ncbi:MAG TPA: M20 family metallopeptidase [Geminicoccaceae bacterium]|nr:M20 family metallopeptidase [Geminicoccaceae bacterium]
MSAPRIDADEILDGIRTWVEAETPTDDAPAVNRLMDRVAGDFAALGARVERVPGRGGFGDHLSVRSAWGDDDGPGVLVLCHLDTVHPIGTLARYPFRVEGDAAYGPGIYDMKGGAYLAYYAYRHLVRTGRTTPLPVRLLYVSDEEVGSVTSRALIEAEGRRARYVLVTEPARDGGRVVTARKGTARFRITFRGRPAHSGSRHADGRSAIRELARQVLVLEGLTDYARGVTVNVGVVRGGTRENVVPEEALALVDLRLPTLALGAELVERIRGLAPVDPDVRIEVEGGLNRPPFERSPAIAALFEHARRLAAGIGFALEDTATGGGSDGNFTAATVPTLDGLGVDGDGAHTHDERLFVSSLAPRATLLLRLFETLR